MSVTLWLKCSNRKKINMTTSFTEKLCIPLLAKCKTKRTQAAIYIEFVLPLEQSVFMQLFLPQMT
jgi:hypothetical protein